ncbi:MAG: hypothetical protein SX243_08235 [Acidobacteriota bacterium]|nr:hypothetical protein [Acidobacteriota bacterium]
MTTPLTTFVRQLTPEAAEASSELFEEVWSALRGMLVRELKRRGSWTAPPSYLGIVGYDQWTSLRSDADALDELAAQCFEFIFVKRLKSLRKQAEVKDTIDGIVALNIRHFLLEVQRDNDPLGFRVFEVLRRVVQHQLEGGGLVLVQGDPRVRNDSLLARVPGLTPDLMLAVDPSPLAERWSGAYLDPLVTASHRELSDLVQTLGDELKDWLEPERPGFRFGDLAAPLKQKVREGWAGRLAETVFSMDRAIPEDPAKAAEAQRRFIWLSQCVQKALQHLQLRAKTRRYFERLWKFLESFAAESPEVKELKTDDSELPSYRELSSLLQIPRERIPGLLETLGERLRECRETMDSLPQETPPQETPMHDPSSDNSPRQRAQAALRAALAQEREGESDAPRRPGDIVYLPEADVPGVSWLILELAANSETFLCAPVDTVPLLGPDDLPLPEEASDEPWVLRNGYRLPAARHLLDQARLVSQVDLPLLHAALASPDAEGRLVSEEDDPTYREWLEEGPAEAHRTLRQQPLPFRRPSDDRPSEKQRFSRPWLQWVAAILALVAVGLGVQVYQLQTTVDQLTMPIFNPPYGEVKFEMGSRGTDQLKIRTGSPRIEVGLILSSIDPVPAAYRIDLLAPDGQLIRRYTGLEAHDSFTLPLLSAEIEGYSKLSFEVYGIDEEGEETLLSEREVLLVRSEED